MVKEEEEEEEEGEEEEQEEEACDLGDVLTEDEGALLWGFTTEG